MNWLRKIVSGKRRRFQDDNYNLDITYITGRVLAMSFPAQGIESFYRNSIENVNLYTSKDSFIICIYSFRTLFFRLFFPLPLLLFRPPSRTLWRGSRFDRLIQPIVVYGNRRFWLRFFPFDLKH